MGRMRCDWTTGPFRPGAHPALDDPWELARAEPDGAVMAVLTATHGPAYRNAGAAMAILPDGRFAGAITSGCIEADLILRADQVRAAGRAQDLRYGEGSPFFDLRLPCGGAVEVALFPVRDADCLDALSRARSERQAVALYLDRNRRMTLGPAHATGPAAHGFAIGFAPPLRLAIFGAGPEATVFADLARSLRHDHLLISHEDGTLDVAAALGCRVQRLDSIERLASIDIDAGTAAILFYHDHDYEPEILRHLLATPAFYIGAQGSRATQATRLARLRDLGLADAALARVRGPIGLIQSARDPRSLAVSVLAEVMALSETATVAVGA